MWARLRLPAGTQDDMSGHDRAGWSRNSGHSVTLLGSSPNPKFAGKKRQRNTSCGKLISMDNGRGSLLFRLCDPEGECYFKGKQEDPNNAKMLTPVAPEVLFIACW